MLILQSLKYQSIVFTDKIKQGSQFDVSIKVLLGPVRAGSSIQFMVGRTGYQLQGKDKSFFRLPCGFHFTKRLNFESNLVTHPVQN